LSDSTTTFQSSFNQPSFPVLLRVRLVVQKVNLWDLWNICLQA